MIEPDLFKKIQKGSLEYLDWIQYSIDPREIRKTKEFLQVYQKEVENIGNYTYEMNVVV